MHRFFLNPSFIQRARKRLWQQLFFFYGLMLIILGSYYYAYKPTISEVFQSKNLFSLILIPLLIVFLCSMAPRRAVKRMRRIKAYVLTISDNEIMLSLGKEGEITMHYFEVSEIYKFPNGDILVKNANNSKGIHVPYCIELPNEVESLLASFKPLIVVPPPTK